MPNSHALYTPSQCLHRIIATTSSVRYKSSFTNGILFLAWSLRLRKTGLLFAHRQRITSLFCFGRATTEYPLLEIPKSFGIAAVLEGKTWSAWSAMTRLCDRRTGPCYFRP